jgi:hypothetical protein
MTSINPKDIAQEGQPQQEGQPADPRQQQPNKQQIPVTIEHIGKEERLLKTVHSMDEFNEVRLQVIFEIFFSQTQIVPFRMMAYLIAALNRVLKGQ